MNKLLELKKTSHNKFLTTSFLFVKKMFKKFFWLIGLCIYYINKFIDENRAVKLVVFIIEGVLFLSIVPNVILIGLGSLIDNVDPTIYIRNATDNHLNEDIFFSSDAFEKTNFYEELCEDEDINAFINSGNKFEVEDFFENYKTQIINVASRCHSYVDYLSEKGSSIDDLSSYIDYRVQFSNNIIRLTYYLTFVLYILLLLWRYKKRKLFYTISSVVYIIAMASDFSNGLTDFLVSNLFSYISRFSNGVFTYEEMMKDISLFGPPFTQALMTVVIIDVIFEIINSKKQTLLQKNTRYIFASMDFLIKYLLDHFEPEANISVRVKISFGCIEKLCNDKLKSLKYEMIRKDVIHSYQNAFDMNTELLKILLFFRNNNKVNTSNELTDKYTCKEFTHKMQRVKELMFFCGYSDIE